jgi:hypothetical protein
MYNPSDITANENNTPSAVQNVPTASADFIQPPAPPASVAAPQPVASGIGQILDGIIAERENWEATAFTTSNRMLYGILQRCYELEGGIKKGQHSDLNDYCTQRGIGFNSSTDTLAKLVKCVFSVDRRRVSTYVTALRAAKQAKVPTSDLAQWLEASGGVQEISLKHSPNYKSDRERAKAGLSVVLNQPVLGKVSGDELAKRYDASKCEDVVLFVAKHNANGEFEIRALIQNNTALNAALASYYTKTAVEQTAQRKVAAAAIVQQQGLDVVRSVAEALSSRKAA